MLKVNRIEVKSQKTTQKKHKPWIVRIFNYECCITYVTGCYSCHWKTKLKKKARCGTCCCSWREKLFHTFLVIAFCMSSVLLFLWIETKNEYHGFDWAIYLVTGHWYFWSLLLLSLFGLLVAYTSLLVVFGFLLVWEGYELYLHWNHKILIVLVILICTFFFMFFFIHWSDRWLTFGLSLKVFAPYVHLSCITVMVLLSYPVAFYLVTLEQEAAQVAIGLPFIFILLCLCVVPWGYYSPCLVAKDKLGPKPDLFGHRGAPMLAPENTMMAFEKAFENGAFGLKTDVLLSFDGVPFLMHDHDLGRTTNIKEVIPNGSIVPGSIYYWDFLSTLNAGKWFLQPQYKPFYNMKPLSEADKEKARHQMIPKLTDLLELAQKEKKIVILNLRRPPGKHPFRKTFIHHVVRVILDSNIEQHLIYWLYGLNRKFVRRRAPGFQQVGRLRPIEELKRENISIISVDYKRLFYKGLRDYKAANITINLNIVNEPWLFSLAWCSRIHSVTTDNIELLRQINHPHYFMTPSYYMFIWFLMDSVSAVFIFAIFYFHWWREKEKRQGLENTRRHTDTESISLQKGKSENQEASDLSTEAPFRIAERPWTLKPLYPALNNSIRKFPSSRQFSVFPKNDNRASQGNRQTTDV